MTFKAQAMYLVAGGAALLVITQVTRWVGSARSVPDPAAHAQVQGGQAEPEGPVSPVVTAPPEPENDEKEVPTRVGEPEKEPVVLPEPENANRVEPETGGGEEQVEESGELAVEVSEPVAAQGVAETVGEDDAVFTRLKNEDLERELREARLAVIRLAEEKQKLAKERLDLEEQVRRLTHSLAEEKVRADRLRVGAGPTGSAEVADPPALAGMMERTTRIVEVDRQRRIVILDAGRANGVRPGMFLGVIQDGAAVCRLRASDIRDRVAAAIIEDVREGKFPQPGDRVVPWTGGAE